MTDHITLVESYIDELMDLARIQNMISAARQSAANNQYVQLELDREQTKLLAMKIKLQDEMFEIARSN